jgi:hypothetical protein
MAAISRYHSRQPIGANGRITAPTVGTFESKPRVP